jgi:hypothetical protein
LEYFFRNIVDATETSTGVFEGGFQSTGATIENAGE